MSDIRVEVRSDRVLKALKKLAPDLENRLRNFVTAFTVRLFERVQLNVVLLFNSKGRLYESLDYRVTQTEGATRGSVFTRGVPYAKIQEEGGYIPAHPIVPRIASVLVFEGPAGLVFAKRVNHPGAYIPGRHYAGQALADMRGEYEAGIREVVDRAIAGMRE